jgi:hypothetical protein
MTTKTYNVLLPEGDGMRTVEVTVTKMSQSEANNWPIEYGHGRQVFDVETREEISAADIDTIIEQFHRR